jgi:hypothetical protein
MSVPGMQKEKRDENYVKMMSHVECLEILPSDHGKRADPDYEYSYQAYCTSNIYTAYSLPACNLQFKK